MFLSRKLRRGIELVELVLAIVLLLINDLAYPGSILPVSILPVSINSAPIPPSSVVPIDKCAVSSAATSVAERVAQGRSVALKHGCHAPFDWPVLDARVAREFLLPEQIWLAGHRGVDLLVQEAESLLSPEDAVITFAGSVAGKNVVSLQSEHWLHSFEPAVTEYAVGETVSRSSAFAIAQGVSDHCESTCVHWGVRDVQKIYRDPAILASGSKIVLKAW